METELFLLIKIGAEEHMTRLLERGGQCLKGCTHVQP